MFRHRVANKWMVLALGWVLQIGDKTTAGLIRGAGDLAKKSYSSYSTFFRTTSWTPWSFWKAIQRLVLERINEGPVIVGIDDTLWQKVGRRIEGCGWYPSKKRLYHRSLTYVFGQCWVCLTVHLPVPFAKNVSVAVPVLAQLYVPKDQCDEGEFRTRLQMVREMLEALADTAEDPSILALADSYYGGSPLLEELPDGIDVIVRLKADSRLFSVPTEEMKSGPGRPRKKGKRLAAPEEWFKQSFGWEKHTVRRYGSEETVRLQTQKALWYHVTHDAPGRVVVLKETDDSGLALFSTDPELSAKQMIESYAQRWKQEILFREAKQVGGAEDPQCRSPQAVRRQTPFNLGLITLVKLWFLENHEDVEGMIQRNSWEHPTPLPSFRIMLQLLRWRLRKKQFSQKWGQDPSLPKKIDELFNQWIRAA